MQNDMQKITDIWFIYQKMFEFFFILKSLLHTISFTLKKTFFETFWNISGETKSVSLKLNLLLLPNLSNGYYPGSTCAVCSKFLSINDLIF